MLGNLLDLRAREAEVRYRINVTNNEISNLKVKIKRLKKVKQELATIKDNVEEEKKKAKYKTFLSGDKNNWKGQKDDLFENAVDDVQKSYKQYYGAVDDVLDNLVDAITRLENQKIRKEGMLSGLRSTLNSILAEIEKIFN